MPCTLQNQKYTDQTSHKVTGKICRPTLKRLVYRTDYLSRHNAVKLFFFNTDETYFKMNLTCFNLKALVLI